MQVSVETVSALERRLRVEIPEEQIAGEVENRLKSLSKNTRIDGFRPGKVPLKLVKQRYGDRVRAEVIGEKVRSSFFEAVSQEQLQPAGTPRIEPEQTDAGQGLSYTATFEIYPEVKPAPVEQLAVERPVCEVGEVDVERMIETLRKQQRQLEPVERPADEGDAVTVDFTGRVDGEVFEGGEAQDFQVEIGTKRLLPGFEEGLVGATAGETRTLELTFPEDYPKQELAGKPVEFEVIVKQVLESRLPELNDEFFQGFGVSEGGLDTFKAEVRRNMEREAEQAVRNRFKQAVMGALYDANTVEVPASLQEAEQERLLEQARNNLRQYGIQEDQLEGMGMTKDAYREQAHKRVALQLLVGELVKQSKLEAGPNEVRALVEKSAAGYEDPQSVINWYYSDRSRLSEVEALVLEDKLVDWISGQATITDKPYTFDALMNKGQTEH